ncbi:hypothetical protein [Variovorax sp. PAMC26660]|uniref:hypothetical protein n=1 Tax=Variovorax sp. PAMC26660 TaxID=2762322 RepID=UPI00164E1732|nr:hypothetical protein [Variovorax sp. PAMC26660]QNK66864.1 hypothetical protein H7F35_27395 [Variovorax sp. PAMC26660]
MSAANVPALCVFSPPSGQPIRGFSDAAGAFWFVTLDVLPAMGLRGGPKIIPRIDAADKSIIGKGNAYGMHPDTIRRSRTHEERRLSFSRGA